MRADAIAIFQAAVEAAGAGTAVRRYLRSHPLPRTPFFLLAVGKAAAEMATAVEEHGHAAGGLIVTKHGHGGSYRGSLPLLESGHPVPDAESARAGRETLALLDGLSSSDLLVTAISGGASALLCAPVAGIDLAAKQKTTDLLLRAGADIYELNAVRKHLSELKGGKLAARTRARILGLLLSDVMGDPLDVIGSGLTAPDTSTYADALRIIEQRGILDRVPAAVLAHLRAARSETPKSGDPAFERVENVIVGSNRIALDAAASEAKRLGYEPLIVSSQISGEARDAARTQAALLRHARPGQCFLSGGETTVTVRGSGKGGRNQEFALAAALAIDGMPGVTVLAGGTDGSDGPTDAAGAVVDGGTIQRGAGQGLNALDYLNRNDSYSFFAALGDLVKTGPTGTNVMDVNILLTGVC